MLNQLLTLALAHQRWRMANQRREQRPNAPAFGEMVNLITKALPSARLHRIMAMQSLELAIRFVPDRR